MPEERKCPKCGSLKVNDKSHEGNVGALSEGKDIPRSKVIPSPQFICEDCNHEFDE